MVCNRRATQADGMDRHSERSSYFVTGPNAVPVFPSPTGTETAPFFGFSFRIRAPDTKNPTARAQSKYPSIADTSRVQP